MIFFKILPVFVAFLELNALENDKPAPTIARTEIRVAKNLNPDDTQTLNVMTRDGSVAQLIVKRRDGKSKLGSSRNAKPSQTKEEGNVYANWSNGQPVFLQPHGMRLENLAVVKNASDDKPGSIISSNRLPFIPKPVNVRSRDVFVKPPNDKTKKARSIFEIDSYGIPVVHGVRVPDDESDEKVWRNARVINGELVPYEKGYKPPPAVPIGELVYASKTLKDTQTEKGMGPYTTEDNYQESDDGSASFGPFSVKDNKEFEKVGNSGLIKFSSSEGLGPYTVADNSKRLIDYIKEINAKEAKRDYFTRRKLRSYDSAEYQPQLQRRMLEYAGSPSYPNSVLYSSPNTKLSHVNFNEGVRTPILQYAHPELGVQPAKASRDEEETAEDNDIARSPFLKGESFESGGRYSQSPYYTSNINSIDYYKNYPYNGYYLKPKVQQPFWMRLTESIKDNVQNGFERMQQLTRPVFDPIVEATHKITHNLGLSHSPLRAHDKVGVITPMGGSIILPALGLVAGGAALGLGAAAVGRFLQPEMRALGYPNDILVIMEEHNNQGEQSSRLKRSLDAFDEQYLQDVTNGKVNGKDLEQLTSPHLWADTPCSKKLFCEVMVRQNADDVLVMEKRMDSLLSIVHPSIVQSVSYHLEDVMSAVKNRNCNKFVCNRRIPLPLS
ncbi:hypothetical protein PPYR_08051 [Photinus pyralis]|uniref:Uncharacterized protein n=1 Tax=Photinus pyralis TaxID=7054 RepID=A0A1Y1L4I9_PHOPY|nr:uncharacterized protein LOC116168821 [Photinus pyralis]KAB0800171.1 hypothetical protein PPYR_08051 [Photinus pyralis]